MLREGELGDELVSIEDRLITASLTFPSVHFNGGTGQPTFPHMSKGHLKDPDHRNAYVKYVRSQTPTSHQLYQHGWCSLEPHVHALPEPIGFA